MKQLLIFLGMLFFIACTTNKSNKIAPPKIKPSANTTKPSTVKPTTPASVKPTTPASEITTTMDFSGPPTTVYKTKSDYNNKVPVTLSEDKTRIVSYPSPKDVFYNGNLAYPTPLAQGYLLDNRGIGKNIAFLNMTYEEYSNLSEVPSLQNMYNMIIDKDPLVQMCNCGNRLKYANVVSDMNRLINDNKLSKCQKIK